MSSGGTLTPRRGGTSPAPGRVHPVFRAIGLVLGPVMMVAGTAIPVVIVLQAGHTEWKRLWTEYRQVLTTAISGLPLGYVIFKAAVSGRDPHAPDADDDSDVKAAGGPGIGMMPHRAPAQDAERIDR